jgi:thiamine-phosphate pyrophosphorylase
MDARLVSWARAVKARHRIAGPVLWLFTDAARLPDPLPAIANLPRGLCGVVFRHDGAPGRAALARQVAALCRARGLALTVAGDWRLAASLRAGVHCRGGARPPRALPGGVVITASAHTPAELLRARRTGATVIFVSPVFPTPSHPGARALGPALFARLVKRGGAAALGGINGATARRCPPAFCRGAGFIGAAAPHWQPPPPIG